MIYFGWQCWYWTAGHFKPDDNYIAVSRMEACPICEPESRFIFGWRCWYCSMRLVTAGHFKPDDNNFAVSRMKACPICEPESQFILAVTMLIHCSLRLVTAGHFDSTLILLCLGWKLVQFVSQNHELVYRGTMLTLFHVPRIYRTWNVVFWGKKNLKSYWNNYIHQSIQHH